MRTIGFIGMGNMAQALAVGMIKGGKIIGEEIFAFAPHQERLHENAKRIGILLFPCAAGFYLSKRKTAFQKSRYALRAVQPSRALRHWKKTE